ncbi:MAG TPA: ABC transporter ATP-binding protein [Candidatus Atribacteria bacterium]|nr:ABC transporter ATP-binding protein [Candidatus Atribacteria bacterium]
MGKRIRLLWDFMKGNRLIFLGAILLVGLSALVSMLSPLVMSFTLDNVLGDKEIVLPSLIDRLVTALGGMDTLKRNIWICGLTLLAITIVNGAFQFLRGKWSARAAETIARNMRDRLYGHIQSLPYDYHVKAETGDLIQRCTSDVETVRRFLAVQLVEVGRAVFMLASALVIMVNIDLQMTLVSMAVVPFIFSFAFVFFIKIQKAFLKSDECEGSLSTMLQENLTGIRVVRAFGRQAWENARFDEKNKELRDLNNRLIRLLAMYWSLSDGIALLQIGVVVVLGVFRASTGAITFGEMTVFTSYVSMLLWPIRQMGRILTDMGKTLVFIGRIGEVLDTPVETQDEDCLKPPIAGDIVFDNVYFEYEEGNPVLKGLSFWVREGQTVAVLGATGSGKSSLVHLLQRLYDYKSGSITIGGVELKKIDKKWLRKHVGLVLQEPFLYSKTIKENISIAKKDATDAEIYEASRIASVHKVIEEFEQGYETPVGERGVTLSGGQKQRVAIARTVINNSSILIFDDSLSAVDTETDAAIRRELRKRSKDVTTFIISHRITTLSEADLILVLEDGRLVQSGTHEELVNQPGLYQRIWSIQNSLEQELSSGSQTG